MSTDPEEQDADEAPIAAPNKAAGKKKKKLILIAGGATVLLLGGGGAFVLRGHKAPAVEAAQGAPAEAGGKTASFIDVPPMVVNLRGADGAPHFLKLHFMLVPGPAAKGDDIKNRLPLLIDAYQPFLRELRPEDLAGSAAVFRIKEEMMVRATSTLGAGQVQDVLIQDLIQQ